MMAFGATFLAPPLAARSFSPMPTTLQVTAAQLFQIADAALSKGDQTTAERAYAALISDPSQEIRMEARFRLAMLASKRGKLTEAATLLREILDHRPDANRARLELAGLLDRMGDKDGAWRQMRAIHAGGPAADMSRGSSIAILKRFGRSARSAPASRSPLLRIATSTARRVPTRRDR